MLQSPCAHLLVGGGVGLGGGVGTRLRGLERWRTAVLVRRAVWPIVLVSSSE